MKTQILLCVDWPVTFDKKSSFQVAKHGVSNLYTALPVKNFILVPGKEMSIESWFEMSSS